MGQQLLTNPDVIEVDLVRVERLTGKPIIGYQAGKYDYFDSFNQDQLGGSLNFRCREGVLCHILVGEFAVCCTKIEDNPGIANAQRPANSSAGRFIFTADLAANFEIITFFTIIIDIRIPRS